jgi:uncharacterized protein
METRDFTFKIKAVDEAQGRFTGLASTYGEPADLEGDVIERGAFTQAIRSQGAGYPLLLAHQQSAVLGIARLEDSDGGLLAHGEIDMEDQAAKSVFAKIRMKALRGLSIGFIPSPGKIQYTDTGRILKEVRLFEISLTPVPANPGAQVFAVKSVADARLLLQRIQAETLEPDMLLELRQIEASVKSLLERHTPADKADPALIAELRKLAADAGSWRM